jgi:hypothetical protein
MPAPTGVLYIYNALAFSTLLSSQETDAHRVPNFRSSLGATHLIYPGFPSCQIGSDSICSNRLPFWHSRISRAISILPIRSGANSTRSSAEAFYRWLPGSGPAVRRSLPLGATRTLRVLSTFVKSFLGSRDAPPREASNLTNRTSTSQTPARSGPAGEARRRGAPRSRRHGRSRTGSAGRHPTATAPAGTAAALT